MLQVVKARALTSRFDAVVPRTTPLRLSFQGTTEPKRRATFPCALCPGRRGPKRMQGLGGRAFDGARGCGVTGVTVRGTS